MAIKHDGTIAKKIYSSNVCGDSLPVGSRWDEDEESGWEVPVVHFVFQSVEAAERARLSFGFTDASAPFTISAERVGAEYQVRFNYIGEPTYQPSQQMVVYYNGAPAGWLWLLPYLVSGEISLGDKWGWGKWQLPCPGIGTALEGGTIPGLPISIALEEAGVMLSVTIDQPYAQWEQPIGVDITFRCRTQEDTFSYKNFLTEDVEDIDWSEDAITIYMAPEYKAWWDEGLVEVVGLAGVIDIIKWGDSYVDVDFDTDR